MSQNYPSSEAARVGLQVEIESLKQKLRDAEKKSYDAEVVTKRLLDALLTHNCNENRRQSNVEIVPSGQDTVAHSHILDSSTMLEGLGLSVPKPEQSTIDLLNLRPSPVVKDNTSPESIFERWKTGPGSVPKSAPPLGPTGRVNLVPFTPKVSSVSRRNDSREKELSRDDPLQDDNNPNLYKYNDGSGRNRRSDQFDRQQKVPYVNLDEPASKNDPPLPYDDEPASNKEAALPYDDDDDMANVSNSSVVGSSLKASDSKGSDPPRDEENSFVTPPSAPTRRVVNYGDLDY